MVSSRYHFFLFVDIFKPLTMFASRSRAIKNPIKANFVLQTDMDECSSELFPCHTKAQCFNIPGSYFCKCSAGYSGDGKVNCTCE